MAKNVEAKIWFLSVKFLSISAPFAWRISAPLAEIISQEAKNGQKCRSQNLVSVREISEDFSSFCMVQLLLD